MARSTVTYTLRLPKGLKEDLELIAQAREMPVSTMIRLVLEAWLNDQPPPIKRNRRGQVISPEEVTPK